jgi:hypothetical protein
MFLNIPKLNMYLWFYLSCKKIDYIFLYIKFQSSWESFENGPVTKIVRLTWKIEMVDD